MEVAQSLQKLKRLKDDMWQKHRDSSYRRFHQIPVAARSDNFHLQDSLPESASHRTCSPYLYLYAMRVGVVGDRLGWSHYTQTCHMR